MTVNGWVLEVMGRFPQPGDSFEYEGLRITVERVDKRKVEQIHIEPMNKEEADD